MCQIESFSSQTVRVRRPISCSFLHMLIFVKNPQHVFLCGLYCSFCPCCVSWLCSVTGGGAGTQRVNTVGRARTAWWAL